MRGKFLRCLLILSLILSSLPIPSGWSFGESRNLSLFGIGVEKRGLNYRLWASLDYLNAVGPIESLYKDLDFFLRMPPNLLWVNLTPGYPPSSPELLGTHVQRVFLFSDLAFKADMERVFLSELVNWDLPKDFSDFPLFWIEPAGIRMGQDGDRAFLLSMKLRVRFKGDRKYKAFYSEVAQRLEEIINKSQIYIELRRVLGLYVIASYLKRELSRRFEEKGKSEEKDKKKKKKKGEKKVIDGVEFYSPSLFSPDFFFSPYDIKSVYLKRFCSNRYFSVEKQKVLLDLGGIKLKRPFIWVLPREFPISWIPLGKQFHPIVVSESKSEKSRIVEEMVRVMSHKGLILSSITQVDKGWLGVFYSLDSFKTWFVFTDTSGRDKVWSVSGLPVVDILPYLTVDKDIVNQRQLDLLISKVIDALEDGLRSGRVYRLAWMIWTGFDVKVPYKGSEVPSNWEELSFRLDKFLSSLSNLLDEIPKERDKLISRILIELREKGWIGLEDEIRLVNKFSNVLIWAEERFRREDGDVFQLVRWKIFPLFYSVDPLGSVFSLVSRQFLASTSRSKGSSKQRIKSEFYWKRLLRVKDSRDLSRELDVLSRKNISLPELSWFLFNRTQIETIMDRLSDLDPSHQCLWLEKVISPLVERLDKDPEWIESLDPVERRDVLDLLWRGIVSIDYSKRLASNVEDVAIVSYAFRLGRSVLGWYADLMDQSSIVELRLLEFIPILKVDQSIVEDINSEGEKIDVAWTLVWLAGLIEKTNITCPTVVKVMNCLALNDEIQKEVIDGSLPLIQSILESRPVQSVGEISLPHNGGDDLWAHWLALRLLLGKDVSEGELRRLATYISSQERFGYDLFDLFFLRYSRGNPSILYRLTQFLPREYIIKVAKERPEIFANLFFLRGQDEQMLNLFQDMIENGEFDTRLFDIMQEKSYQNRLDGGYKFSLALLRIFYLKGDWEGLYAVARTSENNALSYTFSALSLKRMGFYSDLNSLLEDAQPIVSELWDLIKSARRGEDRLIGLLGLLLLSKEDIGQLIQKLPPSFTSDIKDVKYSSLFARSLLSDILREIYDRVVSRIFISREEARCVIQFLQRIVPSPMPSDKSFLFSYFVLARLSLVAEDWDSFKVAIQGLNKISPYLSRLFESIRQTERTTLLSYSSEVKDKDLERKKMAYPSDVMHSLSVMQKILNLKTKFALSWYRPEILTGYKKDIDELRALIQDWPYEDLMILYPTLFDLLGRILRGDWGQVQEKRLRDLLSVLSTRVGLRVGECVDWRVGAEEFLSWLSDKDGSLFLDDGFVSWLLYLLSLKAKREGDRMLAWNLLRRSALMAKGESYFQMMLLLQASKWVEKYADWVEFSSLFFGDLHWSEILIQSLNEFFGEWNRISKLPSSKEKKRQLKMIEGKYRSLFFVLSSLITMSRQVRGWLASEIKPYRSRGVRPVDRILARIESLNREEQRARGKLKEVISAFLRLQYCAGKTREVIIPEIKEFLDIAGISYLKALRHIPAFSEDWLDIWADANPVNSEGIRLRFFSDKKLVREMIISMQFPLQLLALGSSRLRHAKRLVDRIELTYSTEVGQGLDVAWVGRFLKGFSEYLRPWQWMMRNRVDVVCSPHLQRFLGAKEKKRIMKGRGRPVYSLIFTTSLLGRRLDILNKLMKLGWLPLFNLRFACLFAILLRDLKPIRFVSHDERIKRMSRPFGSKKAVLGINARTNEAYIIVPVKERISVSERYSKGVLRILIDPQWRVEGHSIVELMRKDKGEFRLEEKDPFSGCVECVLKYKHRSVIGVKILFVDKRIKVSLFDPLEPKYKGIRLVKGLNTVLLLGEEQVFSMASLPIDVSTHRFSLYELKCKGNLGGTGVPFDLPSQIRTRLDMGDLKIYKRIIHSRLFYLYLIRSGTVIDVFRVEKGHKGLSYFKVFDLQGRWVSRPLREAKKDSFVIEGLFPNLNFRFLDGVACIDIPYKNEKKRVCLYVDSEDMARWLERHGAYVNYSREGNYVFFNLPDLRFTLPLLNLASKEVIKCLAKEGTVRLDLRKLMQRCPEQFYLDKAYCEGIAPLLSWLFPEGFPIHTQIKIRYQGKLYPILVTVNVPLSLLPLLSSRALVLDIKASEEVKDTARKGQGLDRISLQIKTSGKFPGQFANKVVFEDSKGITDAVLSRGQIQFSMDRIFFGLMGKGLLYKRVAPETNQIDFNVPMILSDKEDVLWFPVRLKVPEQSGDFLFAGSDGVWLGAINFLESGRPYCQVFIAMLTKKEGWKFIPAFVLKEEENREEKVWRRFYIDFRGNKIYVSEDRVVELGLDKIISVKNVKEGNARNSKKSSILWRGIPFLSWKVGNSWVMSLMWGYMALGLPGYIFAVLEYIIEGYRLPKFIGKGPYSWLRFRLRQAGVPIGLDYRLAKFLVWLSLRDKVFRNRLGRLLIGPMDKGELLEGIAVAVLERVRNRDGLTRRIICSKSMRLSETLRMQLTRLKGDTEGNFSLWEIFYYLNQCGLLGLLSSYFELDVGDILYHSDEDRFNRAEGSKLLFELLTFNADRWSKYGQALPFMIDFLSTVLKRKGRRLVKKVEYALYYLYELRSLLHRQAYFSALYLWRTRMHPEVNVIEVKSRKQLEIREEMAYDSYQMGGKR